MWVLLKEDAAPEPAAESLLVLPQTLTGEEFETLAGEAVPCGIVGETDERRVLAAIDGVVRDRGLSATALRRDVRWLSKALAPYSVGSRFRLRTTPRGVALDDTEAARVDHAVGLAEGDPVAVGPTISPRRLMNARGRVIGVRGETVDVELDAGDRDRIERATGKNLAERTTLPIRCVEKVE